MRPISVNSLFYSEESSSTVPLAYVSKTSHYLCHKVGPYVIIKLP